MEATTQSTAVEKTVPTNKEIDALLSLYLDAKKNVQNAIEKRDVFGDEIEKMIALHGSQGQEVEAYPGGGIQRHSQPEPQH
jgi:hypothetical protein